MRPADSPRNPRALNPGAWWLWAAGLAIAASRTLNPILLLLIAAVAGFVVAARRSDAPWARSYAVFVKVALVVIAIRVVLQSVLGTYSQGSHVLVTLPELPLPDAVRGIKIGGVVSWEAVLSALYEGGQLGVMLICIGAANALASPLRLLRLLPGALYEVQVACVVALTFAPQLVADARRVHAARRLRGQRVRLRSIFRTTMLPVLEGALDRCVELAAAMESRGFGRTRHLSRTARITTSTVSLAGLAGVTVGLYGMLSASLPGISAVLILLLGMGLLVGALILGRRRAVRSRYRPDPWALPEWLVAACGLIPAGVLVWCSMNGVGGLKQPSALSLPTLEPLPLVAILVALLPAIVSPRQPVAAEPVATPRPEPAAEVAA
ncbi:energy-coupling factor transporter transmembrane component T [Enemella evansiae]|uniref:energy-coupling factor transporter transmembrane component T n=1 Tax=Enemella evansiae TaxID=2016499 RepID=UPI000C01229F|nr:energy-coupling factor transporter transmembrane component T [Enemella evansiae]PFG68867.1 energy-coupling factor transport system permease protein [Propionibacteriaceae bacterium ES.041]